MSVMKPMRITSPDICACAGATAANMPAAASEHAMTIFFSFMRTPWRLESVGKVVRTKRSDAEHLVQLVGALGQLGAGELLDHPAVLHHEKAVCQRGGEAEVLLHHQDGVALLAQRHDH